MASPTLATAFSGLWVAIVAIVLCSVLDQSGIVNLAQAPPLGAAVQLMLPVAAFGVFNTAITFIYVHLYNGRGGAGNGRIPGVVTFILCASTGVLQRLQPGTMDGVAQAPQLGAAAFHVFLPASATVTFFLAVMLIYVHVCTVGGAGAGASSGLIPAAVKLLTKMVLAAAFVTVVLSLIATILAF